MFFSGYPEAYDFRVVQDPWHSGVLRQLAGRLLPSKLHPASVPVEKIDVKAFLEIHQIINVFVVSQRKVFSKHETTIIFRTSLLTLWARKVEFCNNLLFGFVGLTDRTRFTPNSIEGKYAAALPSQPPKLQEE